MVSEQVMISMDWMPTLLAAAGTAPDPAFPPDGENLLPILTGGAPPHPRKLYWRFKAGQQRALREGDWKYLKIAGNEFLFDVVKDPRGARQSQGALQGRVRTPQGGLGGLERHHAAERARPAAYNNPGNFLADHYGAKNPLSPELGGPATQAQR